MISKMDAVIQAPTHSPVLTKGTRVIEREGWYQTITPDFRAGSENQVMISHVSDKDVESCIEQTRKMYKNENAPFRWYVGPMSSENLHKPLMAVADKVVPFSGMAASTDLKIENPRDIHIDLVTEKNFEQFLSALIQAWDLQSYIELVREKYLRILKSPFLRHYIARKKDIVVGTSGMILKDEYAYLIGGHVAEVNRGQGIYKAMTHKRLQDLAEFKIKLAVTHAMHSTSAPILTKIGFETVFEAQSCHFLR